MPKLKTNAAAKLGHGCATLYKPEYDQIAANLCLLGATDPQLARALNVSVRTIHNWKHAHESFMHAITKSKEIADAEVVAALFKRALGYQGAEKEYPPDVTACLFWLKNRQSKNWRDRVDNVLTDDEGNTLAPPSLIIMGVKPIVINGTAL